jgi:hypothetical protein
MSGYKAFYKNKQLDVYAETLLEARDKAARLFKAKKPWDVSVILCEVGSEQKVITPDF